MSNYKGALWFVFCVIVAITLWALNVVYVDNAVPQILASIQSCFPNSTLGGFNPTGWAQLFLALERYAPLFMLALGGIGWILEISLFGNTSTGG